LKLNLSKYTVRRFLSVLILVDDKALLAMLYAVLAFSNPFIEAGDFDPPRLRDSAKCAPQDILVINSLASTLPSRYVEPV
jgi:hypothetical protein